jgi:hypothetical protein
MDQYIGVFALFGFVFIMALLHKNVSAAIGILIISAISYYAMLNKIEKQNLNKEKCDKGIYNIEKKQCTWKHVFPDGTYASMYSNPLRCRSYWENVGTDVINKSMADEYQRGNPPYSWQKKSLYNLLKKEHAVYSGIMVD